MEYYTRVLKPKSEIDIHFYLGRYNELKANPSVIVCKEGTEDESLFVPQTLEGYFHITDVHRDDFRAMGFNPDKLTDADMEKIGGDMAAAYVENQFWIDLEYFAGEYGLPRLEGVDD